MSRTPATDPALVADLRQLIDAARQRAAVAVNAELTLFYWQVGNRINREVLQARLHQSVENARARIGAAAGEEDKA
ncbi:protein of unknown function DUF1016 [Thioalkalivibrio nitratireducens DSM 14787]|uniref:YhcG N-terminal domain-containing protein n=1 Tax=Thioalkalivibrio nitratireducens (strain DSM 14787 / UNIQEM 213 / ALEN2) TaxID=1255043 RepID=L0DYT3_THIND|nr:DUF1016 N-terminal domain-containing protein [Thioalkalivibrio nitratireducens]AGA33516.1 protein of unknown function DUF1016 [Thioalkalivibrio nitratireducens DSM 14787]